MWQLQRSLHLVDDRVDILHLMNLVLLHIESGESTSLDERILSLHSLHDDSEQFHNSSLQVHDQSNIALLLYRLASPYARMLL